MHKSVSLFLIILGTCGALSTAGCLAATVAEELDEDSSLTSELVTPHKTWAKPYSKGTVRALFIISGGADAGAYMEPGTRIREAVELMQRFDIQGDAAIVSGGKFYQLKLGEMRARRLLEQNYDVYIFGNVNFDSFAPELQYKILERVVAGAGLVCCGPKPTDVMSAKRLVAPLPPSLHQGIPLAEMELRMGLVKTDEAAKLTDVSAATKIASAYQLGKGRGVSLAYNAWALTPNTTFSFRALVNYDYWQMLVGRAVLWAAHKDSDIAVEQVLGQNATIQQTALPSQTFGLTLTSESPSSAKAQMSVCRSDGWRQNLPSVNVRMDAGKSTTIAVHLPELRADRYYLDVVLSDNGRVEGFGAGSFEVTSPAGIEAVKMATTYVERGEAITGTATARGELKAGDRLRVQLRDGFDRVLAEQELEATPGKLDYPFSFRIGDWATILMRTEALLVRDGKDVEMQETSFLVPKRRRDQFNFVQWDTPRDVLGYYAWMQMKQAGWNINLGGVSEASQAADISSIPYSTRLLDQKDEQGFMKPCCWNDETKVNDYVDKIVKAQEPSRETGAFVYSLGDEGTTTGCCVHPACIDAYREYLKQQYGTIQGLNQSWGSTYKSWDEVDLLDRKDNLETGALAVRQYARWYDRQAFSRYNLAKFSGRFVKAYKELDPQAITGFEGTGGFGDDYDAIIGTNTFWSPYPGIGDDIMRGVAPRELIRANWMGYEKTADPLINYAWRTVVKGMDSVWYWRWDGAGTWRGIVKPTLDFYPVIKELNDEMRPVREGLGDLLLKSTPMHSGVGIFYSLPSALSNQLENSREYIAPEADHKLWLRATYDAGMDFRYLSSKLLQSEALNINDIKVLLLPKTQAIGPGEAQAIRRFVEDGGTVIADIRPGIFDGHCKPQTPGVLDDLFGVTRNMVGKPLRGALDLRVRLGDTPLSLHLDETNIDPDVLGRGAQALGKAGSVPVFWVNTYGKGKAILLNFELTSYKGNPDSNTSGVSKFIAALYTAVGAKAPVTTTDPSGEPLNFVETHVWKNGEATVIGLWNEMNIRFFAMDGKSPVAPRQEAVVSLPELRYVYDLRDGKSLGKTRKVKTALISGRANFFVALPYPIKDLKVTVSTSNPQPGDSVDATISVGVPESTDATHAVWVDVLTPAGDVLPDSGRVVLLDGGVGKTSYRVAYNDPRGRWRVRARELFTGLKDEASWRLK